MAITKPGKVQNLSILIIISGVLNILGGGLLALLIIIGTIGIGLLCAPILVLPMVLGVAEIIYGINMMADPPRIEEPSLAIAILEICSILFGNIFGLVVGVINLVFINDQELKAYFESLK
ncbi:MAG TPA: hypothetical protein ENF22_09355 [Chloroflexi bacterium]|nr:hypothetical protein [Chloroflexota bacterium]